MLLCSMFCNAEILEAPNIMNWFLMLFDPPLIDQGYKDAR